MLQLKDFNLAFLGRRVEYDVRFGKSVELRIDFYFLFGEGFAIAARIEHVLDDWVIGADECPATEEEYCAPGDEMGRHEEEKTREEHRYEEDRGVRFIGEIRWWKETAQDFVVEFTEVVHAVLEVAHVAEEVLGEIGRGVDLGCRC